MNRTTLLTAVLVVGSQGLLPEREAWAAPTRPDYLQFRALSIDLTGQLPSLDDLAAFEAPGFNLDSWIDQRLQGPAYAERLTRLYSDLLRLRIGDAYNVPLNPAGMYATQVLGPDGTTPLKIHYRPYQHRARKTDSAFCLTQAETGIAPGAYDDQNLAAGAHAVDQATLDKYTALVYPWWLYADYRSPTPQDRFGPSWATTHPGYVPAEGLDYEPPITFKKDAAGNVIYGPDGQAVVAPGVKKVVQVRVCKEEAQTNDMGHVTEAADALPLGSMVSCRNGTGAAYSNECGCGVGLEGCMPYGDYARIVRFSQTSPLGAENPVHPQDAFDIGSWIRLWWAEEVRQFMLYLFGNDRDVRELLTGRYTMLNGAGSFWYRMPAQGECCTTGFANGAPQSAGFFGLYTPKPLFDPAMLPASLVPTDYFNWTLIPDRGPLASGLLTMPAFLIKYGTRRAKAHILYNAFQCRDFVADNIQLKPSTEPNLTIRPGCSTCHATLEPMAAYFSRVAESNWLYLPKENFPQKNPMCKKPADGGAAPAVCDDFYDPAFADDSNGLLRGVYSAPDHAEAGFAGITDEITKSPDFAPCVAQNIAASFLGRKLTADDEPLRQSLAQTLVTNGYRVKAVVAAVLRSDAYRKANNLTADAWRAEGGGK